MEQIGIATINYDQQGNVLEAYFNPTPKFEKIDASQLKSVKSSKEAEVIKYNAEMILASYFSRMNEIELADRDKYEIGSEILICTKYDNGNVRSCSIQFFFRELELKEN